MNILKNMKIALEKSVCYYRNWGRDQNFIEANETGIIAVTHRYSNGHWKDIIAISSYNKKVRPQVS